MKEKEVGGACTWADLHTGDGREVLRSERERETEQQRVTVQFSGNTNSLGYILLSQNWSENLPSVVQIWNKANGKRVEEGKRPPHHPPL